MKAHLVLFLLFCSGLSLFSRIETEKLEDMAVKGDLDAMVTLGARSLYGEGEEKDFAKSKYWYRLAAIRRDFDAAYGLGTLYLNEKDYENAYAWFSLYSNDDPGLKEAAIETFRLLGLSEQTKAKERAKELKGKITVEQAYLLYNEVKKMKEHADIEKRFNDLESRISALESNPPTTKKDVPQKVIFSDKWKDISQWRYNLQKGMKRNEVVELLGEPDKVNVYSHIGDVWHYGYPGGGTVDFDSKGKVKSWSEPDF